MFNNINLLEVKIFATQMKNGFTSEEGVKYDPLTNEEILENLELIDNMLTVMKSHSLLNRKKGLKKTLDGLLERSIKYNGKEIQ